MTENEDVLRDIYREKASLFLKLSSTQMVKGTGEIVTSSVLQEMSNCMRLRQILTSNTTTEGTSLVNPKNDSVYMTEEDQISKLLELKERQRELLQRKIVVCQNNTTDDKAAKKSLDGQRINAKEIHSNEEIDAQVTSMKESCQNLVDLKHSLMMMMNGEEKCWMDDIFCCVSCGELVGLSSGEIRLRSSKRGKTRRRRASQKRSLEFIKRDQMAKHHHYSSSSNNNYSRGTGEVGHRSAVAAIMNQRMEQKKRMQFLNVKDGISKQRIVITCTNCGNKSQCKGISVTSYLRKKQLANNERKNSPQTATTTVQFNNQSSKRKNHNIMNQSTAAQTITNDNNNTTKKGTPGLFGQRLDDTKKKKKKKKNTPNKKSALSDFLSSLNN